jgi:hypothetical protein
MITKIDLLVRGFYSMSGVVLVPLYVCLLINRGFASHLQLSPATLTTVALKA